MSAKKQQRSSSKSNVASRLFWRSRFLQTSARQRAAGTGQLQVSGGHFSAHFHAKIQSARGILSILATSTRREAIWAPTSALRRQPSLTHGAPFA
jgi:hypothetical protein